MAQESLALHSPPYAWFGWLQGASGEEAALDALNARERKELADGQGLQTPEHEGGFLDGAEGSPGSDVTTGPSMLQQCREVQCFERLNDINEGTYGMVYRSAPLPATAGSEVCDLLQLSRES